MNSTTKSITKRFLENMEAHSFLKSIDPSMGFDRWYDHTLSGLSFLSKIKYRMMRELLEDAWLASKAHEKFNQKGETISFKRPQQYEEFGDD